MKKIIALLAISTFTLTGCAQMGNNTVSGGVGTYHAQCDSCAIFQFTVQTEEYPDEFLTHKIAEAINNATPAQIAGQISQTPVNAIETASGKKRYEINLMLSVPLDQDISKLKEVVREAVKSLEASKVDARKAPNFE